MINAETTALPGSSGMLTLLRDENQRLKWMLSQYPQQAGIGLDSKARKRLIKRIDERLRALIAIKRSMLYPLVESRLPGHALATLKNDHTVLQERLEAMAREEPDTLAMDTLMEDLALHVNDHIDSEERRLFKLAQSFDSPLLGLQIAQQREQLLGSMSA